jgi:hypothetical protein
MRRQTRPDSADDSDGSENNSWFDVERNVGETDSDTNPTDVDTDIEGGDEADISWITEEDKGPPARVLSYSRRGP